MIGESHNGEQRHVAPSLADRLDERKHTLQLDILPRWCAGQSG